jgi:hypothetical protein
MCQRAKLRGVNLWPIGCTHIACTSWSVPRPTIFIAADRAMRAVKANDAIRHPIL